MFEIFKNCVILSLFSYVLAFNKIHTNLNSNRFTSNKYYINNRNTSKVNTIELRCYKNSDFDKTIKENEIILQELKIELEDLKNRNCGEVNELYELEELEQDYFKYREKIKNLYTENKKIDEKQTIDENQSIEIIREKISKLLKKSFLSCDW